MSSNFLNNLPNIIDPTAFSVGNFEVRWYSLAYLTAFLVFAQLILWRIKQKEFFFSDDENGIKNQFLDVLIFAIIGLLLGARIGYGLFYDFEIIRHPGLLIYPFSGGRFTGIYGMSFFGGLGGAFFSVYILCWIKKIDFWYWLNFCIPAVGLGYFFGRLGNFFNGELYGRKTELPWGMYFPADREKLLRHPSQLYEAFFEGLIIFIILWLLRNKKNLQNKMFPLFLILYGIFRFLIEFVREENFFGLFTMGQYLSLIILTAGLILIKFYKPGKDNNYQIKPIN